MKLQTRQRLDLLMLLVKKEITLKYKRTYLGFFWSLLNPLLTTLVLFIAFKVFMRSAIEDYTLFLLSALFPWTWFSVSVIISTNTLTGNISLIKKVLFPKRLLILAMIIGQLINLLFALPILFAMVYYYGKSPSLNWVIGIPLLIIVQFIITYGIALIISMINAFFRDMEYIINVCINMLFWMTPIVYQIEAIPEKYRPYLKINPIACLIQSWRDLFLNNIINWHYISIALFTAVLVFLAGNFIFNRLNRKLDEVL